MPASPAIQLKQVALEIANNTLQRAKSLEPERLQIETRLKMIQTTIDSANLCHERARNFVAQIGRDYQCPRCWILNEAKSSLDVPTIVEQGFPNLVVEDWIGFTVKSGTPSEVIVTLNGAINKALANPKVREALARLGAEPGGGSPSEFGTLLKTQIAHWGRVVRESGIKLPQ